MTATFFVASCLVLAAAGCASGRIENPNDAETAPGRRILPPSSTAHANSERDRSNINKLLSDLPDEARGADSEIVIPADAAAIESQTGIVSESERRRREVRAARTDSEIVGGSRMTEDRNAQALGEIDQQLGLEPVEKAQQSPSYILTVQKLRSLFKARQYEDCLIETNEALRHYPKSAQLLTMKGTVHQRLNQIDLALVSYERAFSIEPTRKLQAQVEYLRELVAEREALTGGQQSQSSAPNPKGGK
jgi:tetratricopeptide (TPR) repeat protein